MFGFNGKEDGRIKVYDLIHPDDLSYVAQGHREGEYPLNVKSLPDNFVVCSIGGAKSLK